MDLIPGYGYARQSRTKMDSISLEMQVQLVGEAAERMGIKIVRFYVEAPSTSGYEDRGRKRPEFLKMLEAVRTGPGRCIVIYESARLSRGGGPGWAPVLDAFDAAKINTDRAVSTVNGWLSEFEISIRAAMDREESKKKAEMTIRVHDRHAAAGKPHRSGRRAYGWNYEGLEIVPEEHTRVIEAAERVLVGATLYSIVKDWNERQVPTVTGAPWSVAALKTFLRSPRTVGLRERNGVVVADGIWPPLLPRETWEAVRVALTPRHDGAPVRSYLLSGYLRCGRCKSPLRSHTIGRRRRYICRSAPGGGRGPCGRLSIEAAIPDEEIRMAVEGVLIDPKLRRELETALPVAPTSGETRRERLLDLYQDGAIDKATFRRRIEVLEQEEATAIFAARSAALGSAAGMPMSPEEFDTLWTTQGLQWQRSMVGAVIDGPIEVAPGDGGLGSRLTYKTR